VEFSSHVIYIENLIKYYYNIVIALLKIRDSSIIDKMKIFYGDEKKSIKYFGYNWFESRLPKVTEGFVQHVVMMSDSFVSRHIPTIR